METIMCQCCGKEIRAGEKIIRVEYGQLGFSAHPHARIDRRKRADYFHASCEVAITSSLNKTD